MEEREKGPPAGYHRGTAQVNASWRVVFTLAQAQSPVHSGAIGAGKSGQVATRGRIKKDPVRWHAQHQFMASMKRGPDLESTRLIPANLNSLEAT